MDPSNASSQKLPPKLPLPNVETTLMRYLDAVQTFTPPDQFATTKQLVEDFLKDKEKVDAIMEVLAKRADVEESWAYQWWLEDMYLNNMLPLPINSNPGWVFPRQKFEDKNDMLKYITKIVIGLVQFKQQLEKDELPEELVAGKSGGPKMKLCMKQYGRLLNAYRKPGNGQDVLECSDPMEPRPDEHIVVMAYNHLFKMPLKKEGVWFGFKQLFDMFVGIESQAQDLPVLALEERVALLTSEARNTWFEARQLLMQDVHNEEILKTIESCLFIICLDESPQNPTDQERSQKDMFKQMLTGIGTRFNGSNRWFDKTIQLIVSPDGVNGMCYEHTASEGVAVVTAVTNILKTLDKIKENDDETRDPINFEHLQFKVCPEIRQRVLVASENLDKLDVDTDDEVFIFDDYGKAFIKTCNCSPDAFLQMALQLAYFKLNGALCSTYESASTRRFHCGRVDSIRASHPQALDWVKIMLDEQEGKEKRKEMFKLAIVKQTKVTKENIFGEGVDVPLLGIRKAAEELWPQEPLALFQDETYLNANKFKLSTSQVPISLGLSYMGYGAVVPDGYGVSYNLQDNQIIFAICSFFSCQTTNSRRFADALVKSLYEIRELFTEE